MRPQKCMPQGGLAGANKSMTRSIMPPVKILRSLPPARPGQPCALTIGNFDGVHLGHQALVRTLVADARAQGLPAAVLTFEPHPREYFHALQQQRGQAAGRRLRISGLRDRLDMLARLGVDQVHLARSAPVWPAGLRKISSAIASRSVCRPATSASVPISASVRAGRAISAC